MKFIQGAALALLIMPFGLFADSQSIYCPQNHAYINLGMTTDEVIAACGKPQKQQESDQPVLQKIPVQQLVYNNKGTKVMGFGVWGINTGNSGMQLEINLINNKVASIKLDGSDSNAVSICSGNSMQINGSAQNGSNIQVGDSAQKVMNACGTPSTTNNTYNNEIVPSTEKSQIWIYNLGQYQPTITLTFIDGRLQSID